MINLLNDIDTPYSRSLSTPLSRSLCLPLYVCNALVLLCHTIGVYFICDLSQKHEVEMAKMAKMAVNYS